MLLLKRKTRIVMLVVRELPQNRGRWSLSQRQEVSAPMRVSKLWARLPDC
jgi:hypothetical protein